MNKVILLILVILFPITMILLNWFLYWTGRFIWHNIILPRNELNSKPWNYYLKACLNKEDRLLYTETGLVIWFGFWSIVVILFF